MINVHILFKPSTSSPPANTQARNLFHHYTVYSPTSVKLVWYSYSHIRTFESMESQMLHVMTNGHISATPRPIDFPFVSRLGFSGTADRTAPFPFGSNSRWRPAAVLKIIKQGDVRDIFPRYNIYPNVCNPVSQFQALYHTCCRYFEQPKYSTY